MLYFLFLVCVLYKVFYMLYFLFLGAFLQK